MEKEIYRHLRAGEDYYKDRCDADIERFRKGLIELIVVENGKPVTGEVTVEAHMTDIDFNFGANIFMLNQYDTDAQNRLYEEKFP